MDGRARWRTVAGLLARFGLAAVWLTSGILKALDPAQTYLAVVAYRVLPPAVVPAVAAGLPLLEIGLGVLLVLGLTTRLAAVASVALLLLFVAGVAQAAARGLAIDCGCFGGGGAVDADRTRYGQELLRDAGFLVLAGWLVRFPRTPASLDVLLRGRGDGTVRAPEGDAGDDTRVDGGVGSRPDGR